jgi:hypothetical protein
VPLVAQFVAFLAAFGLVWRVLPQPLDDERSFWFHRLLAAGLAPDDALTAVRSARLPVNPPPAAVQVFESVLQDHPQLDRAHIERAWQIMADPRVPSFDSLALQWFDAVLRKTHDPVQALEVAAQPDRVTIDPEHDLLTIHGLAIPVDGTPLRYYAWYACRHSDPLWRGASEGWVPNPRANRPDAGYARELEWLFEHWGGHGAAVGHVAEGGGLTALTLNRNRDRIRSAVLKAVGDEQLADRYLFVDRRAARGGVNEFRLAPPADLVEVLGAPPPPPS